MKVVSLKSISFRKSDNKKNKEELQQYLMFLRRGSKIRNKKTYTRKDKYKRNYYESDS